MFVVLTAPVAMLPLTYKTENISKLTKKLSIWDVSDSNYVFGVQISYSSSTALPCTLHCISYYTSIIFIQLNFINSLTGWVGEG